MLKHLYVRNFTLIDELDINLYPGFSVITGETGAGKSIILGAIHLLLGQRADTKQIKDGCDRCIVEAHFDLSRYDMEGFFQDNNIDFDETDCIVRREINVSGKSRAFINDMPVQLTTMRELGEQLIDIHSQHQSLLLQKEDFQLSVVDIIASDKKELDAYRQAYQTYRKAQTDFEKFQNDYTRNQENEEFLRFQHAELEKAQLIEDEQEELEQQIKTLTHAEDIKGALYTAANLLNEDNSGAIEQVRQGIDNLEKIADLDPDLQEMTQRLESAYIELKDIGHELDSRSENVNYDPQLLQTLNDRLDLIYSLERKFHVDTVGELIAKRDEMADELKNIDGGTERLEELKHAVDEAYDRCMTVAKRLSDVRKKAASKVEDEMKKRLVPLGIPNVKFAIELKVKDCSPNGIDNVSFLFNANSNSQLQPISQVASGGEIARIMLSLKAMISGAVKLPTIIFDEIDTGVSGRIAEKMAEIMREMGHNNRQVISITHLPQIAAIGTVHYKVSKTDTSSGTVSHMEQLTSEQRVKEIAQMLSGSDISDAAIENARTLLKHSLREKE
ncbi:MAG: DNA repair protein RecN [Prevotella sp.]|nr:DNA repair protein RecN [Prevotella sp.]